MFRHLVFALALAMGVSVPPRVAAQGCAPVPHAAEDQQALNLFWGVYVRLCRQPDGSKGAYARRDLGVVTADQAWLDEVAEDYGAWAATGVLAHEWGHMVQGNVSGTASELQADCLAGVFMRGIGLPMGTVAQFARLNLANGDPAWSFAGHGLGQQRYIAAARGYNGFAAFNGSNLLAICPLSAF